MNIQTILGEFQPLLGNYAPKYISVSIIFVQITIIIGYIYRAANYGKWGGDACWCHGYSKRGACHRDRY